MCGYEVELEAVELPLHRLVRHHLRPQLVVSPQELRCTAVQQHTNASTQMHKSSNSTTTTITKRQHHHHYHQEE